MDCLFDRMEAHGRRPALIDEAGTVVDYLDLAERADAMVAGLADRRRLVLIECANTVDALTAYIGTLRAGHVALLGPPGSADGALGQQFPPDAVFRSTAEGWRSERRDGGPSVLHPHLAVLLATSGSSGKPKLVRLSDTAVAANAASIAEYLAITMDDKAITSLPFHYSYGLSVINSHLMNGATLLVTDGSVIDPAFWSFFRRASGTSFAGVPYSYELLERQNFRSDVPPTLRTMTQAGGRLTPELAAAYADWADTRGVRFFRMYGQTEATARMAYLPPDLAKANPGSIGIAIPGGLLELRDADQTGEGELVYSGPNVMMGYAEQPADLALGSEIETLRTGDLARRNANGLFCITGRLSRFSKIAGYRIGLDDLEARLAANEIHAVVAGDDERLILLVMVGKPETAAAMVVAQTRLPPSSIVAYAAADIPRLASGKVDYPAILAHGRDLLAATQDEAPALSLALSRVLGQQVVLPDNSFQSLGGDSLSYVQASMVIEDHLGSLPDGWESMTMAEFDRLGTPALVPGPWSMRRFESEVAVRAAAITGIVGVHATTWTLAGGASLLLLLAGYNLARFQLPRLRADEGLSLLGSFAVRILLPYYLILIVYSLHREVDLSSWLLLSNISGLHHSLLEPFWFLEALTHCLLLFIAAFAIPAVRRASPVRVGLAMLVFALVMKFAAIELWTGRPLDQRTADAVLYLYGIGFLLKLCTRPIERLLLVGLALAGTALDWGLSDVHIVWMGIGLGGLALFQHIRLPRVLATVVMQVASASFYVYLTHNIIVNLFVIHLHVKPDWLAIPVALVAGIGVREVVERTIRLVQRLWRGYHQRSGRAVKPAARSMT
ncbi:AMP-binding protein [Glacieibacterium sp.]|uniref:AMP-binding protein n=1 Tax=Glacieibacterium sp. TaxID=2860237 RepID=UPI003AFF976F